MKMNARTQARSGNHGKGDVFIMFVDREKMIKQLLEAMNGGSPDGDNLKN